MFAVQIRLVEPTEEAFTTQITGIQRWLNDCEFVPSTFRYTFFNGGVVLRVDFNLESEAVAFANEFSGLGAYFDGSTPAYDRASKLDAVFASTQQ